jgi:hypothetical protein
MPHKITNRASLSPEERRLRSRLRQLLSQAEGFLHGSLIEMARRCGNPRCRCASKYEHKHRSLYIGQSRKGKSTMVYVPGDLEETVRRWAGDYQRAAALLEALSEQGRRGLREAKAKAKAGKKAAAKKKAATKKTRAGKAPRKKTTRKPPSRSS